MTIGRIVSTTASRPIYGKPSDAPQSHGTCCSKASRLGARRDTAIDDWVTAESYGSSILTIRPDACNLSDARLLSGSIRADPGTRVLTTTIESCAPQEYAFANWRPARLPPAQRKEPSVSA